MTKRRSVLSNGVNISLEYAEHVVAEGLRADHFIHGHPLHGAAAVLREKTDIVTLLRNPSDHIVSNFLFVCWDPTNPLREAARRMGFLAFIRANPYFAIFQTGSLLVGLDHKPAQSCSEITQRLPEVKAFLQEMSLVGTVADAELFLRELAVSRNWPRVPKLPHKLRSSVKKYELQELRNQLSELRTDPELAPLFEAEKEIYDFACALVTQRTHAQPINPDH